MGSKVYTVEEMNDLIHNLKKYWRGADITITPSSDDFIDKLEACIYTKTIRELCVEQYEYYYNIFEHINWYIQTREVKKIMDDYIKKGA